MNLSPTLDWLTARAAGKKIFFYGAGGGGLKLLQTIQDCHEQFQINAFLDTYKQGSMAGMPVIPIDKYKHNPEQNIIVITSLYWKEISALLKDRGIHDFLFVPPFWACDYMFTPKDRQAKQQEIKKVHTMLSSTKDQELFEHLLSARTHGSSLAQLHQNQTTGDITLEFMELGTLKTNFPEHTQMQYIDFINLDKIQTAVQAGVYDGEDIISLAKYAPNFIKAYGFEPSGDIYFLPRLRELAWQNRFVHEPLALWHENTTLSFFQSQAGSFVSDSIDKAATAMNIQAITLDWYCDNNRIDKIDFICCDIEDAEISFLKGAQNTIVKDRPQMAISIYHSKKQFLEVPLFLNKLLENYTFKLGHYSNEANETALYAIPNEIYEPKQSN